MEREELNRIIRHQAWILDQLTEAGLKMGPIPGDELQVDLMRRQVMLAAKLASKTHSALVSLSEWADCYTSNWQSIDAHFSGSDEWRNRSPE